MPSRRCVPGDTTAVADNRRAGAAFGNTCTWISRQDALRHFATFSGKTQSQQHIKPLHWYVACRLVLEGGFRPDEITPRPPFEIRKTKGVFELAHNRDAGTGGERTILGGLKTKNVDVVVTKNGIGPVMAVSCKGAIGAYRNLTNRMEEAVGDCTNLHITYPAMVFGYMFVMRANRGNRESVGLEDSESMSGRVLKPNDIAIGPDGHPVASIVRFHGALRELTERGGIRNDVSRYEAVALGLVESNQEQPGDLLEEFPRRNSPLRLENFFGALFRQYDERFVFSAPDLKNVTQRIEWSPSSPVFADARRISSRFPDLDYEPRICS